MLIDELKDADPEFLSDMRQILYGEHWDPHRFLGLHAFFDSKKIIRLYRPEASSVFVVVKGIIHPARCMHAAGFFDLIVEGDVTCHDYQVYHQNGLCAHDPYAYTPTWGEMDGYLFGKGVHYQLFEKMGSHLVQHEGVAGVSFIVWAPGAQRVSVVGDFNFWDGRSNPMRSMGSGGVWELFVPGISQGERYKFEIKTRDGEIFLKADPYGNAFEQRPLTASIVREMHHTWEDAAWIAQRQCQQGPVNIYEVHLGSWAAGHVKNYRELAKELGAYCKELGFTHLELMPIEEHPLDESWGYQVTGFFAPTSRFGTPEDFAWCVDHLHQQGIGVILDWVPGHFPTDHFALARFDGTALYEHADPRQGYHPHWHTYIFNYGRHEVSNFLIASALYWIEKMHLDGLRVDAVASMLYLDYGREAHAWIPNRYGGKENLEAIEFLKHFNTILHERVAGVMTLAEESTSFPGVTCPVEFGGLGFDFKWNMGWMHDSLRYFHNDSLFRRYHHNDLTFGLLYAFAERFVLPFSHDEVVHGKGSLLSKMPGDYWQKFANLRLLLAYQICQPGKKLLFMGAELGQWDEWSVKEALPWHLLNFPHHHGIYTFVKELNHFYLNNPPLWEQDHTCSGFEWVDFQDVDNSVISYRRKGKEACQLLCIHNFTPTYHAHYWLPLPHVLSLKEVFNSDAERYGGSGKTFLPLSVQSTGCLLQLPPLATVIFELEF